MDRFTPKVKHTFTGQSGIVTALLVEIDGSEFLVQRDTVDGGAAISVWGPGYDGGFPWDNPALGLLEELRKEGLVAVKVENGYRYWIGQPFPTLNTYQRDH